MNSSACLFPVMFSVFYCTPVYPKHTTIPSTAFIFVMVSFSHWPGFLYPHVHITVAMPVHVNRDSCPAFSCLRIILSRDRVIIIFGIRTNSVNMQSGWGRFFFSRSKTCYLKITTGFFYFFIYTYLTGGSGPWQQSQGLNRCRSNAILRTLISLFRRKMILRGSGKGRK